MAYNLPEFPAESRDWRGEASWVLGLGCASCLKPSSLRGEKKKACCLIGRGYAATRITGH